MENIEEKFRKRVSEQLGQLSRVQALLVALCTMERLWLLFRKWTEQESTPYLQAAPVTFRDPVRRLLDLFWEQIWEEQAYGDYREEYDRFHEQVESSFDENDGQDVDFGDARLLLDAIAYGWFFFDTPSKAVHTTTNSIVYCATHYIYYLYYDFLLGEFCGINSIRSISREQQHHADAYVEQHPTWCEEVARIEDDIIAAYDYPANKELFKARKELYSTLLLPSLLC